MNSRSKNILTEFSSFKIIHKQYRTAIDMIMQAIEATEICGEPTSALLLGNAGTGKTSVCNYVMEKIGKEAAFHQAESAVLVAPSIICDVPSNGSLNGLAAALLRCLGSDKNTQSLHVLEYRLGILLETCMTKVIFIDELHHLLRAGGDKVCNWIKTLANNFSGTVILSGIEDCRPVVDNDEQLASRYPLRPTLKRFGFFEKPDHDEFIEILSLFLQDMVRLGQFTYFVSLTDEVLAKSIFVQTGGNMKQIRRILYFALSSALRRNTNKLEIEDLIRASNSIYFPTQLTKKNPFELEINELDKIIMRDYEKCQH